MEEYHFMLSHSTRIIWTPLFVLLSEWVEMKIINSSSHDIHINEFTVKYPGGGAGAGAGAGGGEADDKPLALGELAQLTVSNESEGYDVASASKESFRKTWNAKYTLRSHFDGVCYRFILINIFDNVNLIWDKKYVQNYYYTRQMFIFVICSKEN